MTMSLKVIDEALRTDFGFKHVLWIYSGRRGIHCWVCDSAARALPNDARSAVVEYLSVHTSTNIAEASAPSSGPIKKSHKASLTYPFHPMVQRAFDTLEPYFEKNICDGESGQGLLHTKDKCVKLVNTIPDAGVKKELLGLLDSTKEKRSGADRWRLIKSLITSPEAGGASASSKKRTMVDYKGLQEWMVDLVLTYCYPRLDANVSKSQNHLLKAPFCVHPKTGRVCIPIDPAHADDFDPFQVPTLRVLCEQVDAFDKAHPDNTEADINKTDMKACMQTFQTTFMGALTSANKKELRDQSEQLAAAVGDF
jgi:DNA primase small subunit